MDAVNLGNLDDIIFRALIESSSDSIYVKDRELRTVFCNTLFASAVGKKPSELYGKSDIENGWNPEFVKGNPLKGIRGFEQDDLEVLAGATVHATDEPVNIGSEVRVFDTVKSPLRDGQGRIIGILGIGRDVTERKRLQQSLSSEHALLLSLINNLPDHVFLKDRNGRYQLVNQAQARMVGAADPQELVGKTDYDFVTKELADRYAADDRKVIETGEESHQRRRASRDDLRRHPVGPHHEGPDPRSHRRGDRSCRHQSRYHRAQERGADPPRTGRPPRYRHGRDIRVRHGAPDPVLERGRGADLRLESRRGARARHRGGALPRKPPGEADKAREIVASSGEWAGDLHQRSRDGKPMITEARWTLMRDAEGRPSGILAVHTDVTEPFLGSP